MNKNKNFSKRINSLIPGGSHTYSKSDSQFPENAPAAIVKGNGCYLYDLENNKFLDAGMGLTSVGIGHSNTIINSSVKKSLFFGSNFSRPSVYELELAEKFLKLLPNQDMIKFCKNGSTATTAAVKLARAYTNKDLVAFPSDHPFYSYDDWFIGKKKKFSSGVPKNTKKNSVTFKSCNIQSLKDIFIKNKNKIACVIMEPVRNKCYGCKCEFSYKQYLLNAQKIIKKNNAILIFDEMITGFKYSFPGVSTEKNLNPDLITWGKTIANGFSLCALTGKKKIMGLGDINNKKRVFLISTTHGAEIQSLIAAKETINFYKKKKVIEKNHKIGKILISKIKKVLIRHKLQNYIKFTPCEWLISFEFYDKQKKLSLEMKTLFLQEMIKNKVLFQGVFCVSFSHNIREVNKFINAFKKSCLIYEFALKSSCKKFLTGRVIKSIF